MNRRAADAGSIPAASATGFKPRIDRDDRYIPRVIENGDSKLRTLVRADVLVQELDLEALLLRLELDDVSDRNDAHHAATGVGDR
jgi:hypothetical protein